jgi:general secretion pathway protein C
MLSTRVTSLIRRYGWLSNLVFIFLSTYFCARAANALLARRLSVIPSVNDAFLAPPAAPPTNGGQPPSFAQIAERNLFGLKRENLTPVEESGPAVEHRVTGRAFKESELQACGIQAVVRATLVAEDPERSIAVILHPLTRDPTLYTINDGTNEIAEDAVLVAVRHREVVVRRRDHFELCKGEGETSGANAAVSVIPEPPMMNSPSGDPADPNPSDMTGVTKLSETDYRIERAEVDRVLANLNEVAMQARVVPSSKNGKPNGFRMFAIKPGSIYSKIGLQNGDTIQKINGFEMNGVDRALEVFAKLREATSLVVDIQRRGETKTLSYVIN